MKKIIFAAVLSFVAFNASSQFFPPGIERGYQAIMVKGNSHIIIQENSLGACQASVNTALNNNYSVVSACRYSIFFT